MTLTVTLIATFAALAIALFCGWRGARKPNPDKGPRLIPWRLFMLLAAAAVFILVVHLAGLYGLNTRDAFPDLR
jgi:phosphoglycerol transferase MdoB-like AlkP superfamily enzyme